MSPRLVHLSDLHLGFRAFPRGEQGSNVRERDLSLAFRWTLQETIRIRPDLVLITGDLFDQPDPPHTALLAFHRGVALLRSRLPNVRVLLIAGERDTPVNPAELGPVALLDVHPGVEAAAVTTRSLRFRESGIHALLVPHRAAIQPPFPEIRPDPSARWNILLIRGGFEEGGEGMPIDPTQWTYVAVGGAHRPTVWAPNVRSSGALERPERDPWSSAGEERGFISFDLETGTGEFHPVPGRAVVDLAPVRVSTDDPLIGARRLREVVEGLPGGIDGKIVRVRLNGDVLTPEEGVSGGLVAAIAERASYAEYQLAGGRETAVGDGPLTLPESVEWRPEFMIARGGVSNEGEEKLPATGVVLLTGDSAELRQRLSAELRGDAPSVESLALLRLAPPLPESARNPATSLFIFGYSDPAELLRTGLELLAPADGTSAVSAPDRPESVMTDGSPAEASAGETPLEESEEAPEIRLRRLEDQVNILRADWVEASGDTEAKTLEWVRERQDADGHLQGYRDRARELRSKIRALETEGESSPCPTCGKPIGEHLPRLMETLRDEWEAVVQDGRWWKKRREQLDLKPADLRKMEERSLRLHAEVEELSETLERERERDRILHQADRGSIPEGTQGAEDGEPLRSLESYPGLRDLLREAGNLLRQWTEGRIMGIGARGAQLHLLGLSGEERTAEGIDFPALRLALRLTLAERLAPRQGKQPLLLWELHDIGSAEMAISLLEHLPRSWMRERLILAIVPPSVLAGAPERYRAALDFRSDERGRIRSRRIPGGVPKLSLVRR